MQKILAALASLLALIFIASIAAAQDRWLQIPEPPAMPRAAETGMAKVNGIEMYYAVYGAGDPVLLIHGGLGHADLWGFQVAELAKTHKVIVADSRGHGRSTRDAQPYGYDLMASDYLALLDHVKIDRTALVGWSDGGIIGIAIALKNPERLSKLFAHAANVTVDGVDPAVANNKTFGLYIERMGKDYARLSKTPAEYNNFVEQISKMWASEPAWTKEQLAAIKVPTAVVLGDRDEAITRAHTDYMASVIPGAKLVILKDASHFAMLQDPAGYTAAVLEFIDAK
jgi:pimeloyl-ACP methyl ester carboxylesterase